MTEEQAVEAITQRWIDAWPSLQSSVPYTFDNEGFTAVASFARVSIVHSVATQSTIGPSGSRMYKRVGNIAVQLFTAVNVGRKPLAQLADSVRAVFEGRRIAVAGVDEPLYTYAAATRGENTDGSWFMATVVIGFDYRSVG